MFWVKQNISLFPIFFPSNFSFAAFFFWKCQQTEKISYSHSCDSLHKVGANAQNGQSQVQSAILKMKSPEIKADTEGARGLWEYVGQYLDNSTVARKFSRVVAKSLKGLTYPEQFVGNGLT